MDSCRKQRICRFQSYSSAIKALADAKVNGVVINSQAKNMSEITFLHQSLELASKLGIKIKAHIKKNYLRLIFAQQSNYQNQHIN